MTHELPAAHGAKRENVASSVVRKDDDATQRLDASVTAPSSSDAIAQGTISRQLELSSLRRPTGGFAEAISRIGSFVAFRVRRIALIGMRANAAKSLFFASAKKYSMRTRRA
jgi:hypothetical protein